MPKLSHSIVGKLMSPQTILSFFGNFSNIYFQLSALDFRGLLIELVIGGGVARHREKHQ